MDTANPDAQEDDVANDEGKNAGTGAAKNASKNAGPRSGELGFVDEDLAELAELEEERKQLNKKLRELRKTNEKHKREQARLRKEIVGGIVIDLLGLDGSGIKSREYGNALRRRILAAVPEEHRALFRIHDPSKLSDGGSGGLGAGPSTAEPEEITGQMTMPNTPNRGNDPTST